MPARFVLIIDSDRMVLQEMIINLKVHSKYDQTKMHREGRISFSKTGQKSPVLFDCIVSDC